jgi:hypothetical protein
MKYFVAALVATIAAAVPYNQEFDLTEDSAFHEDMALKAIEGQKYVDQVVDDPYSLSGFKNLNGDECMHAIGHDDHVHTWAHLTPLADADDASGSAGNYYQSDDLFNGKPYYVNFEKRRFIEWSGHGWMLTDTAFMDDILAGTHAADAPEWGITGTGDARPEVVHGFSVSWDMNTEWDLEPEWRCLMRPLLVEAVGQVEKAELSIESKALLEEKRQLVAVHEKLVVEAEERQAEANCIELIERAMARLEECEL